MSRNANLIKFIVLPAVMAGLFSWVSIHLTEVMEVPQVLATFIGLAVGFGLSWILESPLDFIRAIPDAFMTALGASRRRLRLKYRQARFSIYVTRLYIGRMLLYGFIQALNLIVIAATALYVVTVLMLGCSMLGFLLLTTIIGVALIGCVFMHYADQLPVRSFPTRRMKIVTEFSRETKVGVLVKDAEGMLQGMRHNVRVSLPVIVIPKFLFMTIRFILTSMVPYLFLKLISMISFVFRFGFNLYLAVHSRMRLMLAVDFVAGFLVGIFFWDPMYGLIAGGLFGGLNYGFVLPILVKKSATVRASVGHRL